MCEEDQDRERLDRLLAWMNIDDPFTHEILSIMERRPTRGIPTMGVRVEGSLIELGYNPDFLRSLNERQARYGIIHEVRHLVFHHCTTRRPVDESLQKKHNVAADLAINSPLEDRVGEYIERIDGILLPDQFGFRPNLSLEQYYEMLPDMPDGKGGGKDSGDSQGGGSQGEDPQGGDSQGEGAQGDGESLPYKHGSHGGFDVHDGWCDEDNALAGEIIRQKIREMENSERFWGNMPGDLRERILAAQRSRIAWSNLLRFHFGQFAGRNLIHTFKKPNRRFGYPYLGYKRDEVDRVLVLWDTSASIAGYELSQFLSETNRMSETNPVDVQMFDHGLQGDIIPFDRHLKAFGVKGRGGTSFREPFQLAEDKRYNLVVCLTDGGAPAIPRPKFVKEVIWAVVGRGKPPVDWGKVVHIDTKNGVAMPEAA